jgi:dephospho-CoA kinase
VNFTKTVVGLTGLYCSGKSTVERYLQEKYGFQIIDVDRLGHQALEEKKDALVAHFGTGIISDGKIDRKILGNLVFSDKRNLKKLNDTVHPLMIKTVENIISNSPEKNICINAALLFEMNLNIFCNSIIIVTSPFFCIIKRALKRDKNSVFKIFKILYSQKVLKLAKKNRKSAEISYISNNSDLKKLEKKIDVVISKNKPGNKTIF